MRLVHLPGNVVHIHELRHIALGGKVELAVESGVTLVPLAVVGHGLRALLTDNLVDIIDQARHFAHASLARGRRAYTEVHHT